MKNYAMILSGGTGTRLGADIPKQYLKVNGKMIIEYVLESISSVSSIVGYVVVADEKWKDTIEAITKNDPMYLGSCLPGRNRQESIYHGLLFLKNHCESKDLILIQDAVRPGTSKALYESCLKEAAIHDGCIPVLPMKDTVYVSQDGKRISGLLERKTIYAGQAPEVFAFESYRKANEALMPEKILQINGSTEPAILAGLDISMIPGEESNYKITTKADLNKFTGEMHE